MSGQPSLPAEEPGDQGQPMPQSTQPGELEPVNPQDHEQDLDAESGQDPAQAGAPSPPHAGLPQRVLPPIIPEAQRRRPWAQMKYYSFHPCIFPAMLKGASPDARAGSLVHVYDREGRDFGAGFYNPKARVPLRVFFHGPGPYTEDDFLPKLDRAVQFRLDTLKVRETTEAFRVIHSDGDGLSGLVVDCYGDVLAVQIHSLGVMQRLPQWLPRLHQLCGTKRAVVEMDDNVLRMEGIRRHGLTSDEVRTVKIRENGIRFEVDFSTGHKTGFFCDQRDNRQRLTRWTAGRRVLDLCCYTGGFALSAKVKGGASEVTGVDLDEKAIAQARRNANLNQSRIDWVHCDAFSYARQMQRNQAKWDVVVLDPPKMVLSRDEEREGARKYEDMNSLAVSLVQPGGLFVTCSCSGLVSPGEFEHLVIRGCHRAGRRLQILESTGASMDHPVLSTCPESRYLKVIWARVLEATKA